MNYIKLLDQRLIEPIGILRNVNTQIMDIQTEVNFEVINLVEGMPAHASLFDRPWGQKMKSNISLKKYRIKLKGNGKKIMIPLDPKEGKPMIESDINLPLLSLCLS
jgi:hypothetical protein